MGNAVRYSSVQDLWIAGGDGGGNTLAYSTNGFYWTGLGRNIFSTAGLDLVYGANIWVAGGQGGNTLAYSTNGFNWTGLGPSIYGIYSSSVAYSSTQSLWVSTGWGGAHSQGYSTNAITWTGTGMSVFNSAAFGITYGENQNIWMGSGQGGNILGYSTNAITWTGLGLTVGTIIGFNTANMFTTLSGSNLWVAVVFNSIGNSVAYSTNGVNWTGRGSLYSTAGYSVACNDVILPIPDYIWLKFDATTYTGSQTLVNASTSGAACNFWSANGSITNTTIGGACALVTNTSASNSSGKWTITTDTTVLPVTAGNGYTIAYWMYIPSNGLPNGNGAECMLANYTANMNTATQGWISSYWAGNYVSGLGASISNIVIWGPGGSINMDSTYFTNPSPYGRWMHIGISSSIGASKSTMNYYFNGINRITNANATNPTASQTINFAIAANKTSINYADVRVYKRAVGGQEMEKIYNYGISLGLV
jgi:hypothetical protein